MISLGVIAGVGWVGEGLVRMFLRCGANGKQRSLSGASTLVKGVPEYPAIGFHFEMIGDPCELAIELSPLVATVGQRE